MSPYQFWIDLGALVTQPRTFALGLIELVASWFHTRRWSSLMFGLPLLAIAVYMIGSSLLLRWVGPEQTLHGYWTLIESEIKQNSTLLQAEELDRTSVKGDKDEKDSQATKEDLSEKKAPGEAANALTSNEQFSSFINHLLLKVLELEVADVRATYLVANALNTNGRTAQSRQLMRRIAPELERGFAPAHSWLAADRLLNLGIKDEREKAILLTDLAEARRWTGVKPMLLSAYADLLMRDNRFPEAMEVLQEAGQRDSRLRIKLASVAKQKEVTHLFESIKNGMMPPRQERVQTGVATELDYIELVSLHLLDENTTEAVELAQKGLRQFPKNAQITRLLSNAFMMAFDRESKNSSSSEVRLDYLDKAMKSDPGNPIVMEKVAELAAQGKIADEEITNYLRDQLAEGKATAVTHLLVAIGHLKKNELDKALVHLEVAQGLAPNNPIILNNLAMCIARQRPDELPKARRMMEYALSISKPDAEMYDTYGEILVMSKDYVVAIRAFEAALQINGERPGTRKKLADVYTKVALTDMAEAVENKAAGAPSETSPITMPPELRQDGILKSDDILSPVEPTAQTEPSKLTPPESK